jgi:hypothetical protein
MDVVVITKIDIRACQFVVGSLATGEVDIVDGDLTQVFRYQKADGVIPGIDVYVINQIQDGELFLGGCGRAPSTII